MLWCRVICTFLLAVIMCLQGPAKAASDVTPAISWEPSEPDIGDLITVTVTIEVPENLLVSFPRLNTNYPGFKIDGRRTAEPKSADAATRLWTQIYRLEPQTTGSLEFPDLIISIHDPKTIEQVSARLGDILIPVRSLAASEADFREIKPVRELIELPNVRNDDLPLFVAASIGLGLIILAGFLMLRRRGSMDTTQKDALAWENALSRLAALQADVQGNPDRTFYENVADILREYMDHAMAVAAPRRTTTEISEALNRRGIHGVDPALVRQILNRCDSVKFAKAKGAKADRDQLIDWARNFVGATSRMTEAESSNAIR